MFSKCALKVSPHTVQFLCSSPSLFPLPLRETDQANRCTRFTHPPFAGSFVLSCFAPARRFFLFFVFSLLFCSGFPPALSECFLPCPVVFLAFLGAVRFGAFFCLSRPFGGFSRVFDSLFCFVFPFAPSLPVCLFFAASHSR